MKLYNDYNSYLKEKYGCKVYRIGLDGGFSCPNRDGTKGKGGCIYCTDEGSRSSYTNPKDTIEKQLAGRIAYLQNKYEAKKFIAYFQAFTGTYASPEKLKETYDGILHFKEIVGLSIGTRPDAVDIAKMKLISSYSGRYDLWLEYGLQSIHDKTLKFIKRGHGFGDFLKAVALAGEFNIPVCAHIILGLPHETKDDMLETAKMLTRLKINGVKIHLFHVLKGSLIEKAYHDGKLKILGQDEYVDLVCDFLEMLSPDIVIQRLTGEGNQKNHIAPLWALDKTGTINKIAKNLAGRKSYQGIKAEGSQKGAIIS